MEEELQAATRSGSKPRVPLGFGNLYASTGDHIGHFYQAGREWRDVAVSYLKVGLEAGEKCVYLIGAGPERQELQDGLVAAGIDAEHFLVSEQLVLHEGLSNPEELRVMLRAALAEIPGKFPMLRWGGDMTWALRKLPTSVALMQWETHCNGLGGMPAIFVCQYELRAFGGSVMMDAMRTHPICIVSNAIHRNPFYEEPETFLHELRRRGGASVAW